jgi:hypothetical protein
MDTSPLPHEIQTALESSAFAPLLIFAEFTIFGTLLSHPSATMIFYLAFGCLIFTVIYATLFAAAITIIQKISPKFYCRPSLATKGIATSATLITTLVIIACLTQRFAPQLITAIFAAGAALNFFVFIHRRSSLIIAN